MNSNQCLDKATEEDSQVPSIRDCNGSRSQQWLLRNVTLPEIFWDQIYTKRKKIRIDWATSAYISATFLSSKKWKSASLLQDVRFLSHLNRLVLLLTSCEPAFLSKDVQLPCSETAHWCLQDWKRLSSRNIVKNIHTTKQSTKCAF